MPIPKSVAVFNKYVTNRFFLLFAGGIPPFAVLRHRGRRSGREYETPLMAFKTDDGFVFALTYGRKVDWVRNLLAQDNGILVYDGKEHTLHSIRLVPYDETKERLPRIARLVLDIVSVDDCLQAGTG